jgi:ubiquinone/menaquinone biosynthesis C-methylase UbiE
MVALQLYNENREALKKVFADFSNSILNKDKIKYSSKDFGNLFYLLR